MSSKSWEEITYDELYNLFATQHYSDSMIAELYGVTKSMVRSKRQKMGISAIGVALDKAINSYKENIKTEDINNISKAITQYAFRSGPIEKMHAKGQLSQEDMKELNKFTHNKIATLLYLLKEEKWSDLSHLYKMYRYGTAEWDEYTLCIDDIESAATE